MVLNAYHVGLADGPTELHKSTMARLLLRQVKPCEDVFPSYTRSRRLEAAHKKYGAVMKEHGRL